MSTNPFRRSSFKGFDGSGGSDGLVSSSVNVPHIDIDISGPLSVNTKVPPSTQKHVNFASPPAVPISPVSYPPSPESTRFSPAFQVARPVLPLPTDYSRAMQSDAFRAEARTDESDGSIEQARMNATVNTVLAAPSSEKSKEDAVRDTLSRFAGAPKRPVPAATGNSESSQTSSSQKQTMDVDAFKRLLLTGDTTQPSRKPESLTTQSTFAGDSSSGTDTASISQPSLFDPTTAADYSSASSDETDSGDAAPRQQATGSFDVGDSKRKPPPPKPRRGKPISDDIGSDQITNITSFQVASAPELTEPIGASGASKKAPPPPLARRRSQNSSIIRPPSSRNSSSSDVTPPVATTDAVSRPPPPPRAWRTNSTAERRSSGDLPPTEEEPDHTENSAPASRKASDTRPPPPASRNSSKRISTSLTNAPPLPPPRRGRGSSRSSIDSQRPSMANVFSNETFESNSGEFSRTQTENRRSLTNTNANDILASLAALQREVDEARTKAER